MLSYLLRMFLVIFYAISIFILLVNCAPTRRIDPELIPYDLAFDDVVSQYCDKTQYNYNPLQVSIEFDNLDYPTLGYCSVNHMGSYSIRIDRTAWDRFSPEERKQLISHEKTHCLFRVGHSIDPTNYMFAYFSKMEDNELDRQIILFLKAECER